MKTIRFTAFSILLGLLALASACQKETNPEAATQSGSKIMVTGQDVGTGLKSTLSGLATIWKGSDNYSVSPNVPDRVGIYSWQARTQPNGFGAPIVNAQFSAVSSAASSTFSGTMYWYTGVSEHTFWAYYPYSGSAGSPFATAVPISLSATQTQSAANSSAHIGDLDFMVATPKTAMPAGSSLVGSAVNLSYNHLFTVLEFQIKGTGQLKAVKLVGTSNPIAFSGGTIDITQATPGTDGAYAISPTGTTTQAVVTLTTPADLNASTATSVYMVINPGTQTGDCLVGLSSDGTNWTYISKAAPVGGFLRGKKYVVAIDQASSSAVGFSHQGGKVFYILKSGDTGYDAGVTHGLIAATADQSNDVWITGGSTQSTLNGHTSFDLGTGQANTNSMIVQAGYTGGAAKACDDYSITVNSVTYSDWYLPSKDELNLLYSQKSAVGGIANALYWSSSESDNYYAWDQAFFTGSQNPAGKNSTLSVRAIRSF